MNVIIKKLFNEVNANHISAVKKILRENKNLNLDVVNKYGDTVLIRASLYGYEKCLRILIEAGADLNIKNKFGDTALICASIDGYEKCVRALLEAGAKPNIKNNIGFTSLLKASENGNVKCVELLLEYGADPNIHTSFGYTTALMRATRHGDEKCVELLLKGGADPNIQNSYGQTALDLPTNVNVKKMLKKAMAFKQLLPFFVKKKLPKSLHLNKELLRLTTEYLFSRKLSKSKKNIR